MALEGSIRDFSLADIFQLIGIQRKTGVLTLRQKEEEVKVSFLNGMVVNADSKSGRVDDRLGSVLVKSGKLTQEGLNKALKLQKETLKKLGHVLVENQLARSEDLRDALVIQITQIVYRLFRWKDGQYHFEQDVTVDYEKESFTPMSAESILMEGMRMIDEWPIIERKITSYDLIFEKVPLEVPVVEDTGEDESRASHHKEDDFDAIFGGGESKAKSDDSGSVIKLTREESLVYEQVNGQVTVQEVIDRTMLSEFEVCRAFYDLANRNLITVTTRERKQSGVTSKSRHDSSPQVARFLKLAMVLWVVAAAALGVYRRNPINLFHGGFAASPAMSVLTREVAVNRLHRIGAAIDLFVLETGRVPSKLDEVVTAGYLEGREILDPWNGAVEFRSEAKGFEVAIRTAADAGAAPESLRRSYP